MGEWEVGGWGRDPKKCAGRDWGMGSSTIQWNLRPVVKYHLRRGVGFMKFLENGSRPQPPTSPLNPFPSHTCSRSLVVVLAWSRVSRVYQFVRSRTNWNLPCRTALKNGLRGLHQVGTIHVAMKTRRYSRWMCTWRDVYVTLVVGVFTAHCWWAYMCEYSYLNMQIWICRFEYTYLHMCISAMSYKCAHVCISAMSCVCTYVYIQAYINTMYMYACTNPNAPTPRPYASWKNWASPADLPFRSWEGVGTSSRLLKIIGLFCRI